VKPEFELLILGAGTSCDETTKRRIAEIASSGIDWDELTSLAVQQGLAPLLYRNVRTRFPGILPADVEDRLRDIYHANSARNLRLTAALLKILESLEAGGVKAMPYKGPSLADFAYGNVALRQFNDLDILVRPCDVLRARDLMVTMGYRPERTLSRTQAVTLTRWNNEISLTENERKIGVELQWNIVPGYFSFPVERLGIWGRQEKRLTNDFKIPTLPPEELLLVLCIHGCKDLWRRLIWVRDIAELIGRTDRLDWPALMELSRVCGSHRMLCIGLRLAEDLFGPVLPGPVLKAVAEDPAVDRLARGIKRRIFGNDRGSEAFLRYLIFYFNFRERWQDRLGLCGKFTMNLVFGDWNPAPLPDYLFPLAYVLRPVTLLKRYGEGPLRQYCRTGLKNHHAG
jgi:hypothetical protein